MSDLSLYPWLQLIFIGLVKSTGSEPSLGLKLFGWTAV